VAWAVGHARIYLHPVMDERRAEEVEFDARDDEDA
jgi:hypothetical protein